MAEFFAGKQLDHDARAVVAVFVNDEEVIDAYEAIVATNREAEEAIANMPPYDDEAQFIYCQQK